MKKPSRRKCKICCEWFIPKYPNIYWCNPDHGAELAIRKRNRDREKAERELKKKQQQELAEKKDKLKARRLAVKPLSYFKSQAQQAFNAFIRERDKEQPCISCERFHEGQYHAGHYLTIKAHPELRFDEDNCHKQCSACNNYLSGNIINYKLCLIEKIGQERFDRLMSHHTLQKWKRDDYEQIRDYYKDKLRRLSNDNLH
ncbi:protein NinG [Photorhabdus luminescens]|uniref:Protein NinG n=1 Tax=Photorhabdus akhurstii TaxID=171438 RepID=A0ABX8LWJ6_9GAMM|nr:recombination protein NinG [Photorhabdus akhurstii]QXF34295.1 protein NinG [Photorhabdus akhurstii]UJD76119.1 protein NinG [Photorhabdus luminescens]